MTDQEAEVLTERLTRVWNPKQIWMQSRHYIEDKVFSFGGEIGPDVDFMLNIREGETPQVVMQWGGHEMECFQGKIESDQYVTASAESEQEDTLHSQFTDQWMNFFRRCCWLSGCPIEASAHEKAEWMQGFTREEIQAWNLTI